MEKSCLGAVVLECLCAGGQHLPSAWRGLGAAPGQGGSWALLVMPEGTGWEFLSKDCLALKSCGQEKALNASHQ